MPHLKLTRLRGRGTRLRLFSLKFDRDMFAVRWVTLGLRVDVNCAPKGSMLSMVPFASFTIGGNWVINADTLKTIAPGVACSEVQARFLTLDARNVSLQPRGILARGSFAQLTSTAKMGDGVVNGWTTCDTSTDFCTIFRVFTHCKRLTIGRFLPWMCLVKLCMVVIWVKQQFCVRVRFASSADRGVAMQGARLSWTAAQWIR